MKSVPLPYVLGIATAFVVAGLVGAYSSPRPSVGQADPPTPTQAPVEQVTPTPPLAITQYSASRAVRPTEDGSIKARIARLASPSSSELELQLDVVHDVRGPAGNIVIPRNAKMRGTAQRQANGSLLWRDTWTVSWSAQDSQYEFDVTGSSNDLLPAPTPGRMVGPLPLGVGRTINLVPKAASPLRKVSPGGTR